MCRFYIAKGAVDLSKALKLAARRDPYSERGSHGDGWGFVAAFQYGYIAYKSGKPAWEDPMEIPLGEAVLAHARSASPGEPLGAAHAHPYIVTTRNGRVLAIAHNGSVDKWRIPSSLNPEHFTDSFILANYLAERWDDPRMAVESALPYVKTALNLAILEITPALKAYVYTYYRDRREYYALYLIRGGGYTAVVSSTLLRYLEVEATELENGTFLEF